MVVHALGAQEPRAVAVRALVHVGFADVVGAVVGDRADDVLDLFFLRGREFERVLSGVLAFERGELAGGRDEQRAGLSTRELAVAAGHVQGVVLVAVPLAALETLGVDTAGFGRPFEGVLVEVGDDPVDAGLAVGNVGPVIDVEAALALAVPVRDRCRIDVVDGVDQRAAVEVGERPAVGKRRRSRKRAIAVVVVVLDEFARVTWIRVRRKRVGVRVDVVGVPNVVAPAAGRIAVGDGDRELPSGGCVPNPGRRSAPGRGGRRRPPATGETPAAGCRGRRCRAPSSTSWSRTGSRRVLGDRPQSGRRPCPASGTGSRRRPRRR